MSPTRKTALVAGIFYLITFVSIPTFVLYSAVKSANYIVGSGSDMSTPIGAILEMIVGLASIGTALALYPVLRRQGQSRALGFVADRITRYPTRECDVRRRAASGVSRPAIRRSWVPSEHPSDTSRGRGGGAGVPADRPRTPTLGPYARHPG